MVPVCAAGLILLSAFLGPDHALMAEPLPVAPTDQARYEKVFDTLQQNTLTYSADILQTLDLQGLAHPLVSRGILYYAAPDRLLIRFSQPTGEWMLVRGSQLTLQKQGKPVEQRNLTGQGKNGSHMANLLDFFHSGTARWHRDFSVSMTRSDDELHVHLKPWMTPSATFQGVDSIETTLQLPACTIRSMEIAFNSENRIHYEFSRGRRNLPLSPTLFLVPKESAP